LILAVFLTGVLMMSRTTLFGNMLTSNAMKESAQLLGERARTEMSLKTPTITTADGSCTLTVTGDNTGSTAITDFPLMDVIVQFAPGANDPQRLNYTTGDSPPSTGDWAKNLTPFSTSDKFQPGIFNPGETVIIKAKLAATVVGDTTGTVTVAAPNGVIDTASFSLTTPC